MKTLIVILAIVFSTFVEGVAQNNVPLRLETTQIVSKSLLLAAGETDTLNTEIISIEGDSVGFIVEVNGTTVSAVGRMQYVTAAGYATVTSYASMPTVFTVTSGVPGTLSNCITGKKLTQIYGKLWYHVKNNAGVSQTVTIKIFRVRRK
jgi:hypothetical protein